jgi:hypothetical protein
MNYLMKNDDFLLRLINKQFEIIGEKVTYADIENGVKVNDGKKEKYIEWWKVYFFEDEDQYEQWKQWVMNELKNKLSLSEREYLNEFSYLDLVFGLNVRINNNNKKEGIPTLF